MEHDPFELVGALAPASSPESEVLARVRSNLMDTIDKADSAPMGDTIPLTPRRRKRRRILPIAAAAVVLAISGGTAWAVMANRTSAETGNLSCPTPVGQHSATIDPGAQSIIPVASGDPVVDCTNNWRTLTTAAPPVMTAYDNGQGAVVVLAADATPPASYQRIAPGTYQSAGAATLQRHLDDVATGLPSTCRDFESARSRAQSVLDELGMDDWKVEQGHPGRVADGSRNCAAAGVDQATRTVQIFGAGSMGVDPFEPFAREVHRAVDKSCVGTDAAADIIRVIAAKTTVDNGGTVVDLGEPGAVAITAVADPKMTCADVTVTVGGNIAVTLEGPK